MKRILLLPAACILFTTTTLRARETFTVQGSYYKVTGANTVTLTEAKWRDEVNIPQEVEMA